MNRIPNEDAQAFIEIWTDLAKAADAVADWSGRHAEHTELRTRAAADKAMAALRLVSANATAFAQRIEQEAADWDVEQVAVLGDVLGVES